MTSLEDLTKQLQELPNWGKAAVAGGLAIILYIPYRWLTTTPRKSPIKEDWKSGVNEYSRKFLNIPKTTHFQVWSIYINSQGQESYQARQLHA